MNIGLKGIFYFLFISFILSHFLIPQGSHIHFCCETFKANLCTLDEDNHNVEKIFHHFHHNKPNSKLRTNLNPQSGKTEKHIDFTLLSSEENLQPDATTLNIDLIPQFYTIITTIEILQIFPLSNDNYFHWSFYRHLTSRSPPIL